MTKKPESCFRKVEWPSNANVKAFYTTRHPPEQSCDSAMLEDQTKGFEQRYASFNLATHVDDSEQQVLANRIKLSKLLALPAEPIWLNQVHGTTIYSLETNDNALNPTADGSFTECANSVCCVMTADCLPVLLTNQQGSWVSAVHAGWRGLADGILQQALSTCPYNSSEIIAWLGPAISQKFFEVGEDVRQRFVTQNQQFNCAFEEVSNNKYMADLYLLARIILKQSGVSVFGGDFCTYGQEKQFYSYRRDGKTGRMACLIWIEPETEATSV